MNQAGAAPTSRRATISLVLGATAFLAVFIFPFASVVLGIPATTNGVVAKREIDRAEVPTKGRNLADYGITAGVVALLFGFGIIGYDLFNGIQP